MNDKSENLISVIIPCFNSGATIKKTIDSVQTQTWENKEIIIINDGSNDKETTNILKEIENVKVINQENKGLPSARNKGVENSLGSFLLFLDADDWLEHNALELMYFELISNRDKNFVFADIKLEGESNQIISKGYNFFEQLFLNQIPYSIFIKKKDWQSVGGYDEKMQLGYEDWEFNIRLGKKGFNGLRVKIPLFHYTVNKSGMLLSKSSKYHAKIWRYIREKHKSLYKPFSLLKIWLKWKDQVSTYPLFIFLICFPFVKIFPDKLISILFIFFRNIKWFFVRNNLKKTF